MRSACTARRRGHELGAEQSRALYVARASGEPRSRTAEAETRCRPSGRAGSVEAPHWQEASSHSAVRRSRAGLAAWACPSAARAPASPARSSSCRELGPPPAPRRGSHWMCNVPRLSHSTRTAPPAASPRPLGSHRAARPAATPHWETQLCAAEQRKPSRDVGGHRAVRRGAPRYAAAPRNGVQVHRATVRPGNHGPLRPMAHKLRATIFDVRRERREWKRFGRRVCAGRRGKAQHSQGARA